MAPKDILTIVVPAPHHRPADVNAGLIQSWTFGCGYEAAARPRALSWYVPHVDWNCARTKRRTFVTGFHQTGVRGTILAQ